MLEELGLLSMFTAVLRVPFMRDVEDVRMVLEESQAMTTQEVSVGDLGNSSCLLGKELCLILNRLLTGYAPQFVLILTQFSFA